MKWVKRYPFLCYGLICMLGYLLEAGLASLGAGYDDRGLGTVAFLFSLLWAVLAFPFHLASEYLFEINDSRAMAGHWLRAFALGWAFLICLEVVWQWRVRSRP